MGRITKAMKRIRLVYCCNKGLRVLVLCTIVICMAAMIAIGVADKAARDRYEDAAWQAAGLEHENQKLDDKIGNLGSADSVEQIAKDEEGMQDPDTEKIEPKD